MALVVADRVQETSSTAGTGTLSLAGPVAGYQSFVSGVGSGNTTYYTIFDQTAQVWEVGYGTVTAGSPDTLSRTTVLANSSGTTSPLNLVGNSVAVWCDYPAEKAVYKDASGNVTLGGALNVTGTTTLATSLTGLLKTASGVVSNAVSGTDYAPATSGTSILKGNGTGGFSSATSGTDYAPATSGSSILYGNGAGGFSNVTVGTGVSFVGGTLSATGTGGTVTTVSVTSANGLAGTVLNPTTTPAITLSTSVSGVLKGNGTAISAAVSGTDYCPATSGSSLLKGNGAGGTANTTATLSVTNRAGGTVSVSITLS